MSGNNVWVIALLFVSACATGNGEDMSWEPLADPQDMPATVSPQDGIDAAGMGAPEPKVSEPDTSVQDDGPSQPTADDPAQDVSDDEPMADDPDTDLEDPTETSDPDATADTGSADDSSDTNDTSSSMSDTTPTQVDPADLPAAFMSLADLEPSPNNIPECPATAPENPWGPCVGVPVYATCDYGTQPAPFYTCVCDWIHWICVGFQ